MTTTHSRTVQTRRRRAVDKKKREREDKLAKKVAQQGTKPEGGPGQDAGRAASEPAST
jgi:hypothetical protein